MKALLDTNIILDHLLARKPFAGPAMQMWQACVRGQYNGYVGADVIVTRDTKDYSGSGVVVLSSMDFLKKLAI